MSTKCTIDRGENWSVYEDAADESVWVETRGVAFAAFPGSVRVLLPTEAIDAIRKASADSFPHLRAVNAEHQARRGSMKIKVGDLVDYHSVIGREITSTGHTVQGLYTMPNRFGCDVATISGKAGVVAVAALTLSPANKALYLTPSGGGGRNE